MKHIAERLVRFANKNKIINAREVTDIALRKFAMDRSINHKIRRSLKAIDPQLELLVPYQVDDHEQQFKRYLQNEFGLVIDLSYLSKNRPSKYRKLQDYGTPHEVIKRWGLDFTYGRNLLVEDFQKLLNEVAENRSIRRLRTDHNKLYMAILHQAKKENMTVREYVERLGFTYVKG